jgi:hypothetical protein
MTDEEMLSIMEQFENMGFLHDTGKRRPNRWTNCTTTCNANQPHTNFLARWHTAAA